MTIHNRYARISEKADAISAFEGQLLVPSENIEFLLRGCMPAPWADYMLNPRRLRGSDFLMRWSQGSWSEHRLVDAVNETHKFFAIPYGPSGVAPSHDVRAFELYFERLQAAGLDEMKRPDLLVFLKQDADKVEGLINSMGGVQELPFVREEEPDIRALLSRAVIAVECENSLWRAKQMPDYGSQLAPQRWLGGAMGLKKSAVLPTVIIKEEDRAPLLDWQQQRGVNIHVWHVFYDMAFGLPLNRAVQLIDEGLIKPTVQTFQAPGGATTKKTIYKFYYQYAYRLGESDQDPQLVAAYIEDKNGHILPYVRFKGGHLALADEAMQILQSAAALRE